MEILHNIILVYLIAAIFVLITLPIRLSHEEMVGRTLFYDKPPLDFMCWEHVWASIVIALIPLVNVAMACLTIVYAFRWFFRTPVQRS